MKTPTTPLLLLALAAITPLAPAQFDPGPGGFSSGGGGGDSQSWTNFKFPNKTMKLAFRNASVDSVLALFERVSGITIVKDPALTGTITITSAKTVSVKDAFQILSTTLGLKNFELRKEGNLLVIAQRQQRQQGGAPQMDWSQMMNAQEQSELRVYPIKYANASQVARVVNEVFQSGTPQFGGNRGGFQFGRGGGGGGNNNNAMAQMMALRGLQNQGPTVRASADDFSNSVIVNAPSRQQRDVSDLIGKIDKQTDQPLKTQIYRLTYAAAADVQPVIQQVLTSNTPTGRGGQSTQQQAQNNLPFFLRGAGASQGQSSVTAETRTNSVVVSTTEENQALVAQLVTELDRPVELASTTFVFPLVNARADDIADLLNQAFGSRTGNTGRTNNRTATTSSARRNSGGGGNNSRNSLGSNRGVSENQEETEGGGATANINIPIDLEDPNASAGELQTNIAVAQGGGFGQFGNFNRNRNQNQNGGTTARTSEGRIVNVQDLTDQITVIPDNNTNSVIVVASPGAADLVQQILSQLDRIPEQVIIETIIVEASLDDTTRLGVEFGLNIPNLAGSGTTANGGSAFGLQNANPALQGGRFTLSGGNLTAFVNALRTDSRFNVLSTPKIFTSNNQEAEINISQSIPYVLSTRQDINGNLSFNYAFQDVGVVLTVTPRITSNGYVTMDIQQTANDLQGYTSFNAPIVNQREANTTVSVLDGETVVLGGIIRNTVTATTNKVPLLGDIPILGNLFRSTTKTNSKTELLVLLTPRIVRDDAEARRIRLNETKQLSGSTQDQLKKTLPPENAPITDPLDPKDKPNDPGKGAGQPVPPPKKG